MKKIGNVAYKLNVPEALGIHLVFYVSSLKPYVGISQKPDPIEIEDDEDAEYEIESILKDRRIRGT